MKGKAHFSILLVLIWNQQREQGVEKTFWILCSLGWAAAFHSFRMQLLRGTYQSTGQCQSAELCYRSCRKSSLSWYRESLEKRGKGTYLEKFMVKVRFQRCGEIIRLYCQLLFKSCRCITAIHAILEEVLGQCEATAFFPSAASFPNQRSVCVCLFCEKLPLNIAPLQGKELLYSSFQRWQTYCTCARNSICGSLINAEMQLVAMFAQPLCSRRNQQNGYKTFQNVVRSEQQSFVLSG